MSTQRNIYFYNRNKPEMKDKVESLYKLASDHHFNIVNDYREASLIASIGGDGAFLQAVRKTGFRDDCLYIGISTLESPSLYCDFHIDYTDQMFEAMTNEKVEVRRYPTIEVTIDDQTSLYCLNEFSIRSAIIKTFVLDVFIDDFHFETFRGDGMVVATPTGSTAYNKSLSGSIVDPHLHCLQVSEMASLNNNRYRTLGSSFILSGKRKLTLKVVQDGNDHPTMGMDNEALSIQHVEKIDIKLSGKIIKTVKLKDNSFWEKVKRTFL